MEKEKIIDKANTPAAPHTDSSAQNARKPYRAPSLKDYGSVARLTKGGVISTTSDSGMNSMRPP
jgi:hypothetical protein